MSGGESERAESMIHHSLPSLCFSGMGSQHSSGNGDSDRPLDAIAKAVQVHPDTTSVMYFA